MHIYMHIYIVFDELVLKVKTNHKIKIYLVFYASDLKSLGIRFVYRPSFYVVHAG